MEKIGGKAVLRKMPETLKNNRVPEHLKTDWQLISDGLKADVQEQEEGVHLSLSPKHPDQASPNLS